MLLLVDSAIEKTLLLLLGACFAHKTNNLVLLLCLRQKNEIANILSVFILNISGPYAVISNTPTL